jgi:uncharacterized protein (DUF885 family)
LPVAVMWAGQGCASARRPPSLADTVTAVLRVQNIGDDYWRYLQTSKPEIPARAGAAISRLPSPDQEQVRRDGRFARSTLLSLDEVFVDALPQDGYVTWLSMRWQMEAMAGWAAFHWTRLWDLSPGRSAFDRALQVLALQQITGPGAGQRLLGLVNSIPMIAFDLRDEYAERARRGIRLPRMAMDRAIAHVRSLIAPAGASPFGLPSEFVVSPDSAWRVQLSRDISKVITERVNPSLDSLLVWLERERDQSPDEIGLSRLPGGEAHYETLLRYHSTVDLSPVDAHAIGLREVARIASLTAESWQDAGLPVDRELLRAVLASDSRFVVGDANAITERAVAIHDALLSELDTIFPPSPVTQLSIGIQPESESSLPLALYLPPDVFQPVALYLIHPARLASRSLIVLPGLIAGDLMPGLHRQRATQFENLGLPLWRRFSEHAGFVHGWQLYALHVTDSLSRSITPAQRFGLRMRELAAACGLVVDTGINALGWTREDALSFLRAWLPLDDDELELEFIVRAIEAPGMLGAGTLGARELRGLRQWAERELGDGFTLAAFHRELLRVGSVPLPVLGSHLERWIWEKNRPVLVPPAARR